MSRSEEKLIQSALEQFGRIEPCAGKTLTECFCSQNGHLQFWFNDASGNTHLLYIEAQEPH